MDETAKHLMAYCERAGDSGLWAEPLNAVTNLFFILFAWFGYRVLRRQENLSFKAMGDIWILVLAMVCIGLGSGLWHTWAAPGWTVIVDVIPIYVFINLYVFSLYRRLGGLSWTAIGLIWIGFTSFNITIQNTMPPDFLAGSIMYGPTLLFMLITTIFLAIQKQASWKVFSVVTILFLTSLTFRTFDNALCEAIPIGTHFIWHVLNAIVLYRLVLLLLPSAKRD